MTEAAGLRNGAGCPWRVLTINCGSTSTKVAYFEGEACVAEENLHISPEKLAGLLDMTEQLPLRRETLAGFIRTHGIDMKNIDIIASRGGPTPPCGGGAYAVNRWMTDVLRWYDGSPHASQLSPILGYELAEQYGIPHIVYDSVMTDELDEVARLTGLPGFINQGGSHVLNSRAVGRRVAEGLGRPYEECRFVIAHCGGGASVTAHRDGRIADSTYDVMTPERVGAVQLFRMIELCYSGKYTFRELNKLLLGRSGFVAWLGTSDAREAAKMAESGDGTAMLLFRMMAHQLAKAVGSMAAALDGRVDRVIFTGGLAHSELLMGLVTPKVAFIAPVELVPGELEMEALALGARRVLDGREKAKEFDLIPAPYASKEDFYAKHGVK